MKKRHNSLQKEAVKKAAVELIESNKDFENDYAFNTRQIDGIHYGVLFYKTDRDHSAQLDAQLETTIARLYRMKAAQDKQEFTPEERELRTREAIRSAGQQLHLSAALQGSEGMLATFPWGRNIYSMCFAKDNGRLTNELIERSKTESLNTATNEG